MQRPEGKGSVHFFRRFDIGLHSLISSLLFRGLPAPWGLTIGSLSCRCALADLERGPWTPLASRTFIGPGYKMTLASPLPLDKPHQAQNLNSAAHLNNVTGSDPWRPLPGIPGDRTAWRASYPLRCASNQAIVLPQASRADSGR